MVEVRGARTLGVRTVAAPRCWGSGRSAFTGASRRSTLQSLRSVRENGTRYVLLAADTAGHDTDMSAASTSTAALIGAKDETIGELREMVAQLGRIIESRDEELRREREARIEEKRRHDTILLRMTERIPELEAPQRPLETHQADGDGAGGVGHSATEGAQDGSERRSWWRRFFGL